MLASKKLIDALNKQVGHELGASNQYVTLAAFFAAQALTELAGFFYRQAEEEREHALKLVHFIVDAGGRLAIPQIPAPKADPKTAEEAVELALDWEKEVTRQIYALVEIAREESNYIALRFLDWFVNEQFEEVTTMGGLLQVVRRAGEKRLIEVEHFLAREGDEIEGPPPD
jgi:ferritin